jgi:hypothetical protein
MDTVVTGAVAAHVVDHSAAGHDHSITTLLDPFDVPVGRMRLRRRCIVHLDLGDLPQAAQVRRALHQRLGTAREDGRRERGAIPPGRRVRDGDRAGATRALLDGR